MANQRVPSPLGEERIMARGDWFMGSSVFRSDLLTTHKPQTVGVPEDHEIVRMADRGSLAPQSGEGSRVRGEAA
jgi:hypothetical protein